MQIYNKKEECNAEYPIFKYLASTSFNFIINFRDLEFLYITLSSLMYRRLQFSKTFSNQFHPGYPPMV